MIVPHKGFDNESISYLLERAGRMPGTTGPSSIDPETECPYAPCRFQWSPSPIMVRVQKMADGHLGIERLLAVTGGSMGGNAGAGVGPVLSGRGWRPAIPHSVTAAAQRAADRVQT